VRRAPRFDALDDEARGGLDEHEQTGGDQGGAEHPQRGRGVLGLPPVSHHGIRPAATPGPTAKKAALPAAAVALRIRRRPRDQEPTAAGAAGWPTPIMASRVTSAASSSSLIPSVPDGRRGITR